MVKQDTKSLIAFVECKICLQETALGYASSKMSFGMLVSCRLATVLSA